MPGLVDAWRESTVGDELLRAREATDLTDLDRAREGEPDAHHAREHGLKTEAVLKSTGNVANTIGVSRSNAALVTKRG